MTLILSGTDGLSDVDGSASTPAIRGTDTNTGIFFPAADTIAFAEGGAEAMRIDSSGQLLIGTSTSSTFRLDIYQPLTNTSAYARIKNNRNRNSALQLETNLGNYLVGAGIGTDTNCFQIFDNNASAERMRIDSSGNVQLFTAGTSILNSSGNKILNQTGSVLQVIEGSTDTAVTVSTTNYTDTGLTASITPSSTSNKVLVIFSQQATLGRTSANTEINLDLQLLRGSTVLEEYADYAIVATATGLINLGMQVCATYLDSPNSTSSVTYKLQGRPDSTANSLTAYFQTGSRGRSSIVLMEIAG